MTKIDHDGHDNNIRISFDHSFLMGFGWIIIIYIILNFTEMLQGYKYSDLTGKIIGCGIKIHNTIGRGFQEVIYQRCMAIEFKKCKLDFEREKYIFHLTFCN